MSTLDVDATHDRLALMILLAVALHASVILGVSFSPEPRHYAAPKLEITLAQHRAQQAPEKADFLAQSDQEGSGSEQQARQLTTTQTPDFQDSRINEASPRQQMAAQPDAGRERPVTSAESERQVAAGERPARERRDTASDVTILQRSMEIASLEAQLDIQRQAYAKRPRVRRLTSVATKRAEDALYLHNWRTRVEAVGNRNYPAEARDRGIYGELRMMVALLPNGEIHEIKILKSSGSPVLDRAAQRIVRMAAPFKAFPAEMQRHVDVLEIIRTWRFHRDRITSSG